MTSPPATCCIRRCSTSPPAGRWSSSPATSPPTSGCRSPIVRSGSTRPLPAEIRSWVRIGADSRADGPIATFDVTLCDAAGAVLVEIEGFAIRRLDTAGFGPMRPPTAAGGRVRRERRRSAAVADRGAARAQSVAGHPPAGGRGRLRPGPRARRAAGRRLLARPRHPDRPGGRKRGRRAEGRPGVRAPRPRHPLRRAAQRHRADARRLLAGAARGRPGRRRGQLLRPRRPLADRGPAVRDDQEGLPRRVPDLGAVRGADDRQVRGADRRTAGRRPRRRRADRGRARRRCAGATSTSSPCTRARAARARRSSSSPACSATS